MFELEPDATRDTDSHTLPPDPEEEVKSTTRSSQVPISLGIVSATTGAFTSKGADIVIFWGSFEFQFEQEVSIFEVHWPLSTPLFNCHTSPTLKEEDLIEEIQREEGVFHTQRNAEGGGGGGEEMEANKDPQFNTPTPLVGEEKVTITWPPSEVNSAPWTSGGDEGFEKGEVVGEVAGPAVGKEVGVGDEDGWTVGAVVGSAVGAEVGETVGAEVGGTVGAEVGGTVGAQVGGTVGAEVGEVDGPAVGKEVADSIL
jgi:hypothetical protein